MTLDQILTWLGLRAPTSPTVDEQPDWVPCPNNDPRWLWPGTPLKLTIYGIRQDGGMVGDPADMQWYYLEEH